MENAILTAQKSEITEHFVYQKLSQSAMDPHNKSVLKQISDDELKHYDFWKKYTRQDAKPNKLSIWKYYLISRIFGITFGIKLMEKVEGKAQAIYEEISKYVPAAIDIEKDEKEHERKLIDLIDEERLRYVGSMVLGLNDALVELTGALAGFTLASEIHALLLWQVSLRESLRRFQWLLQSIFRPNLKKALEILLRLPLILAPPML